MDTVQLHKQVGCSDSAVAAFQSVDPQTYVLYTCWLICLKIEGRQTFLWSCFNWHKSDVELDILSVNIMIKVSAFLLLLFQGHFLMHFQVTFKIQYSFYLKCIVTDTKQAK